MKLRELSIIQYQNVSKDAHIYRLWLSLAAFKNQLEYFANNDFLILSMDDAIEYMVKKKEINKKRPISLTFDNGYLGFYEDVFPLLAEYQFPATVLISPKKVGTTIRIGSAEIPYLTWSAIRDLAEHNVSIGAYEDDTWNINDIPEKVVKSHIVVYRRRLEDKIGRQIRYYGVKEGVPNSNIRDLLISEGYKAFLTQCPTNRKPDLFSIGRIQVDDEDFNIFLTKISSTYLFFKDKRSWKYIREYNLDKLVHSMSEALNRLREKTRKGS